MRLFQNYSMAAVVLLLTAPGAAQPLVVTGTRAEPTECELHVWPGSNLGSVYFGWFHGSTVNGQTDGRQGYPALPPNPMDTATQAALLAEQQPQMLIHRHDYRLVMHAEALDSRAIRTSTTRLGGSDVPCYAELIVDDVILQQDVFNGSFLKTLFRFRDFGADTAPRRRFGLWVQTRLPNFPPKRPEDFAASLEQLKQAYRENIMLFANALVLPTGTPGRDRGR